MTDDGYLGNRHAQPAEYFRYEGVRASLQTHRLIFLVPNSGPLDISSNMSPNEVIGLLRWTADQLEQGNTHEVPPTSPN